MVFGTSRGQVQGTGECPVSPSALRSSCENTYLSWTRNAAICVVAGAGLFVVHAKMPRGLLAGIAFVDLGLLFIVAGSCEHVMTSFKLLQWSIISIPRFVWICSYTGAVLTVWLFGVSQLIGYKDQLHYLSKCVPRLMSYTEVNRTKPPK
ncbi:uncharacterized protein [Dysidea avara]|uniref:uncharacterized protein isoform X2 n=1 Tax=Dysidea avara TaxID=196820 RepID=UPI0033195D4C